MFALRIKVPKGYRIAPHTHPRPELVTVISGKLSLGFGQSVDRAKTQALPAGSFASMAPGVAHYVLAEEDSVYQINAVGPWGMDYLDPKDDPRLNGSPDPKSKFYTSERTIARRDVTRALKNIWLPEPLRPFTPIDQTQGIGREDRGGGSDDRDGP